MNRLRVQLILAFMLVVLFAVGVIAILIVKTTNSQFRQYVTHSSMTAAGSGLQQLIAYYQEQGGWDGVEGVLRQSVFVGEAPAMPALDSQRRIEQVTPLQVTLADAAKRVVYDEAGDREGTRLRSAEIAQALPINEGDYGEVIGYLLLSVPTGRNALGRLEQRFLDQMEEILVIGATLAVGLALILGIVISRNLTAPLQRLASAARSVASGDLGQQLKVEGSAEMVEVAEAFNDMTAALGNSERQRQNMVADVAHELRTPLTVLQGSLRAMLDGVYPTDQVEISHLYDETRLLSRLVDDLRELALVDAGQLRLHPRPTDVGQIVRSTVESLSPAAEAEEVSLTTEVCGDLPRIEADSDRVAQVLRNLLINAVRHTPAGGVVAVKAACAADAIEITVSDTGEGIAPEDLPHIFERFWRADPARVRAGGTGLGLSIAQSLVQAQGGRMWAESTPGQGSTFRFTLPRT